MTITKTYWYWGIDMESGRGNVMEYRYLEGDISGGKVVRIGRSPMYESKEDASAGMIAEMTRIRASMLASIEYLEKLK